MDWSTVYGAQNDNLESMLARQQVNNSVVLKVAQELQARKDADRQFGLQQKTLDENTKYREAQQKSLDDDRKERGVDRDESRALVKTQRFLTGLSLRKKGDPVSGADQVQFINEGMAGLNKAAGPDDHEAGPHFHFGGTSAQEDADARQAAAEKAQTDRERHERVMEGAAITTAGAAAARANNPGGGRGQLSGYQLQNLTRNLRGDYNKVTGPAREMTRQLAMMDAGLAEAKKGNMNAGTQAIISTFNKIIDPTSVVRESEYARSPEGMALMQRIQGALPKLTQGGIGMTPEALEQFGGLAREFTANAKAVSERLAQPIFMQASDAGIEPTRITGDERQAPGIAAPAAGTVNYRFNPQTGKLEKVGG